MASQKVLSGVYVVLRGLVFFHSLCAFSIGSSILADTIGKSDPMNFFIATFVLILVPTTLLLVLNILQIFEIADNTVWIAGFSFVVDLVFLLLPFGASTALAPSVSPFCDYAGMDLCDRARAAVTLGFFAFFVQLVIFLLSAYHLHTSLSDSHVVTPKAAAPVAAPTPPPVVAAPPASPPVVVQV